MNFLLILIYCTEKRKPKTNTGQRLSSILLLFKCLKCIQYMPLKWGSDNFWDCVNVKKVIINVMVIFWGWVVFSMNCFIPVFKRWALEPDHWSLQPVQSLTSYTTLNKFLNLPGFPQVPHSWNGNNIYLRLEIGLIIGLVERIELYLISNIL